MHCSSMLLALLLLMVHYVIVDATFHRPHILFVVMDDVGWADTGIHEKGGDFATPHLDKLAGSGIRLDNYYTQTVCSPTRTSLMTGKFPFRVGMQHITTLIPGSTAHVPLETRMLPEYLRLVNYERHMVGKWHLGYASWDYTPVGRGFQSHFGYYQGQIDYYNKTITYVAKGTTGLDFWHNRHPQFDKVGKYSVPQYHSVFIDILQSYTKQYPTREAQEGRPLFVYYALQSIHIPLESGTPESPRCPAAKLTDPVRRTYCGMTVEMDDIFGDIQVQLEKFQLWNDTLLIVTTDNGGMVRFQADATNFPIFPASVGSNYPLRGSKTTMFEGGVRSTAFVNGGNNVIPPHSRGKKYTGLLHSVDLATSILSAAGLGALIAKEKLDGFDVIGDILSPTSQNSPRVSVPINIVSHATQYSAIKFYSAKDTGAEQVAYKLIIGVGPNAPGDGYWPVYGRDPEPSPDLADGKETAFHLFDLDNDPTEHHNLVAKKSDIAAYKHVILEGIREIISYIKGGYHEPQATNHVVHPKSLPFLHNGTWAPFLSEHEVQEEEMEDSGKIAIEQLQTFVARALLQEESTTTTTTSKILISEA